MHPASSIDRLDERIRRWIWAQGWTSLRDAQERAIAPLLDGKVDVIIAAATASGKTEAAFLPILTRLTEQVDGQTLAIYVSPLKALINDQWGRLEQLCESLELPVIPWHGDIQGGRKRAFLKNPHGVLLITPESLEALFVRRGHEAPRLFQAISHLVIDELHAFIGSDRGKQMQSLLYRIEIAAGRRIPRVGLSATLGDMSLAAEYLRCGEGSTVEMIISESAGNDLKVQIRGYVEPMPPEDLPDDYEPVAHQAVADHLFKTLRGTNNLVFPNSRAKVELYTDCLRKRSEAANVPMEFWPHHGSLSKGIREDTERALKDSSRPATGICTNTLELGIDIGAIKSVAQIGPGPSVASLRQRLGRSGRRKGEPKILRGYAIEQEADLHSSLSDQLRAGLVQQIAQIQLLAQGWFEPPRSQGLHLSTLVQQILSMIAESGGAFARDLYAGLMTRGAFNGVSKEGFVSLLKAMAEKDLLIQESSGMLLHGPVGEQHVNRYEFYAAFVAEEEWTIDQDGNVLGTLPILTPIEVGKLMIFAGRRWRIIHVDEPGKRLSVRPDPGGLPPTFSASGPNTHTRVRQQMRQILASSEPVSFLDPQATTLLHEGRQRFGELHLGQRSIFDFQRVTVILPWVGDDALLALSLLLKGLGIRAEIAGMTIEVLGADVEAVRQALATVAQSAVGHRELLSSSENLVIGKWDWVLPRDLLMDNYAASHLDLEGAKSVAGVIAAAS